MANFIANPQIPQYPIMKKTFLLLMFLFATPLFSQELLMDTEDVHAADVIEPKFNGGDFQNFIDYVQQQFDFSKVTKAGTMVFSFVISESGAMTNVRVVKFVDVESATEIIRVLKRAPKWESAKRAGKPFAVTVKFPLTFQ